MYKIVYTNRMKKDVKLMKKQGKDLTKLINILSLLANDGKLSFFVNNKQRKELIV